MKMNINNDNESESDGDVGKRLGPIYGYRHMDRPKLHLPLKSRIHTVVFLLETSFQVSWRILSEQNKTE